MAGIPADCSRCFSARIRWKGDTETVFISHLNTDLLHKKEKKKEKQNAVDRVCKLGSALRNTVDGEIIVHIEGQRREDRNLEPFDEAVGKRLEVLLDAGELYHEVFDRSWMSCREGYSDFTDFVVISVKKTQGLATVEFNTKISNDFENINPVTLNILSLLSKTSADSTPRLNLETLPRNKDDLYESRHIQLKSLDAKKAKIDAIKDNAEALVDYIWSDLRLKDNVTSMSKVDRGGSYYLGIEEKRTVYKGRWNYTAKEPNIVGFKLNVSEDEITRCLKKKVVENLCVLRSDVFEKPRDDFVSIRFLKADNDNTVLEIAISATDGIVFYDKEGPRAYVIENGQTKRMDKTEWLRRLKNHKIKL